MDSGVGILRDIDVLRELEFAPLPPSAARQPRLAVLRRQAIEIARERGLVRARACWRLAPLDEPPDSRGTLRVAGHRLRAPRLVPRAGGRLTGLAIGAATIGDALEREVSVLFGRRQAAIALALDGVGNAALFALASRAQDRIAADARRRGLTVAGELRAGDPGLALRAQEAVLAICGAATIGIALAGTLMMRPAKSTTFVQGVGVDLPPQTWSRCERCRSRERCAHGRARAAAGAAPG